MLDGKGLKPALPYMATGVMPSMITANMGCQEPLHPTTQITVFMRPESQMKMIRHQTIGQHAHWCPLTCFIQQCGKRFIVSSRMEDLCASIPSIDDVIAVVGCRRPRGSWHADRSPYGGRVAADLHFYAEGTIGSRKSGVAEARDYQHYVRSNSERSGTRSRSCIIEK